MVLLVATGLAVSINRPKSGKGENILNFRWALWISIGGWDKKLKNRDKGSQIGDERKQVRVAGLLIRYVLQEITQYLQLLCHLGNPIAKRGVTGVVRLALDSGGTRPMGAWIW
jgi:hypothetical protein